MTGRGAGPRPRSARRWWLVVLLIGIGALLPIALWSHVDDDPVTFRRMALPEGIAGDCKMVGDLDRDGLLDVVVAGKGTAEPLTWYRNGTWVPRKIAESAQEFSNDCAVADLNGDGFLDIVVPDGTVLPNNLYWFENPGSESVLTGSTWNQHAIGHTTSWCKDVRVVDLDSDGHLDVVARPQSRPPLLFFNEDDDAWTRVELLGVEAGREGMAVGDLDANGSPDLVVGSAWVQNPGGGDARDRRKWQVHPIGEAPQDFKAFVADVDGDSDEDVLLSSSEDEGPIVWWERVGPDPSEWLRHVVVERASAVHTLWSEDLDLDGDRDILAAELKRPHVTWYRNLDGDGRKWKVGAIETEYGSIHNGVIADLDRDGDLDLFGAGFTGRRTKATIWWNQINPGHLPIGPFAAVEVTQHHVRALGSVVVDLNGDGFKDIASGPYWYRNPGGDMGGPWEQKDFLDAAKHPFDVIAFVAADNDTPSLVAMTPDAELLWLKAERERFRVTVVGSLPQADHGISSQGVEVAQLVRGGLRELVVSNGGDTATGVGIYAFQIVQDGPWPRRRITDRTSDEGIAVGDIDRDGDLDVIGTRGNLGEVEWYANPGTFESDWQAHSIATLDNIKWLDRVRVADLNCDGRLDIVVTEENRKADEAESHWLEQPMDPKRGKWRIHTLTSQGSTNSLDVADFDRDGDMDIVTGEHRGGLRVIVWENTSCGSFESHLVDRGRESHLGTKAVDLDRDGDLDLVSIAWDEPGTVHLWRNDAIRTHRAVP